MAAQKRSAVTIPPQKPRQASPPRIGPVVGIALLALVMTGIMVFSLITGSRLVQRYTPLVDAAMEIKLEAAVAHLWFEEILSGDRYADISSVWRHLDQSAWYAKAMLHGGVNPHGVYQPLDDPVLRAEIEAVLQKIAEFRAIAQKRWAERNHSGPGSAIDQRFDAVFADFLRRAEKVEAALKMVIARDLFRFQVLQWLLIALVAGLAVLAVIAFLRYERVRSEATLALAQSEEKYRHIFESSGTMISLYDEHGVCLMMNQNVARWFGGSPDSFIGKGFTQLHPEAAEEYSARIAEVIHSGEIRDYEDAVEFPEGERWLLSRVYPVRDSQDRIYAAQIVSQDVTERKKAEQDKQSLEMQLRQAQKMEALGTLAGGIAHDFNNILAAIIGYGELALDDARRGKVSPEEIQQILKASGRARELVRQILTFGRKGVFELKPLNLNQVVVETLPIIERTIPKMISLEMHLDQNLNLVNGDASQFEQVLLNLATNANDAMPEGGKLVIETDNLSLDEEYANSHLEVAPGDYVRVTVSDTGEGMDKAALEKIYDPFYTTKGVGKGTGLGLATVYGIVRGHGGNVFCYSEPGSGTTFKIYFPALKSEPAGSQSPEEEAQLIPGGGETILLVDDEASLLEVGQRSLSEKGYSVVTAASGEEALEVYRDQVLAIDLVIMDLSMPGMGGHKALQEILALNPQAKVLIASGYSLNGQVQDSLRSGAAGYIPKPFRRAELLQTVRRVLDRHNLI